MAQTSFMLVMLVIAGSLHSFLLRRNQLGSPAHALILALGPLLAMGRSHLCSTFLKSHGLGLSITYANPRIFRFKPFPNPLLPGGG